MGKKEKKLGKLQYSMDYDFQNNNVRKVNPDGLSGHFVGHFIFAENDWEKRS